MIIRYALVLLFAFSFASCGNSTGSETTAEADTAAIRRDSVRKEAERKKEMLKVRNKMEDGNPATELPMTIDTGK